MVSEAYVFLHVSYFFWLFTYFLLNFIAFLNFFLLGAYGAPWGPSKTKLRKNNKLDKKYVKIKKRKQNQEKGFRDHGARLS